MEHKVGAKLCGAHDPHLNERFRFAVLPAFGEGIFGKEQAKGEAAYFVNILT